MPEPASRGARGERAGRHTGFAAMRGDRLGAEGPIDLCVLGLGMNGHIAMNEPGASLQTAAHVARLTKATLAHPMLANTRSKPGFGLTLGMAEILASREILLLVNGANK